MHSHHSALFHFRQTIKDLPQLSERQQIMTLKLELFHAFERANDFQDRSRALDTRVAELEAQVSAPGGELDAFARHLNDELVRATSELASAKTEHTKEVRRLRLELLAAELQCDALDDLCRSLIATIERAADREIDGDLSGPTESDPEVRASAS